MPDSNGFICPLHGVSSLQGTCIACVLEENSFK
jgi:hypothetical protein